MSTHTFTLVRHGETDQNKRHAFVGVTNPPLNPKGQKQAHISGKFLQSADWNFEIMISSPLLRCKQTAEIIQEYVHVPLKFESALRERNYGIFENKTRKELQKSHPELLNRYRKEKPFVKLPEGESAIDLETRIQTFLETSFRQSYQQYQNILIISHLNPIRAFLHLFHLKNWDVYFQSFHNTSVTRIRTDFENSELLLLDYSCYEDTTCN